MSKKRGVSLDEKRHRMLQIFYEKREFFTLKELEKIAPKEKGIVVQSVKDVLQALINDGLVMSDKIGTAIYFWSFPGENITATEKRVSESTKKIVETEFKLINVKEAIRKEEDMKRDTETQQALLENIKMLKAEEDILWKQIAKFSDADPDVIANITAKAQEYKEAANTWTDNIFAIQSWCNTKFSIPTEELNRQFNIPEDLDYME